MKIKKTDFRKKILENNFELEKIGKVNRFTRQHQGSREINFGGHRIKQSFGEIFLFIIDEIYHEKTWKYKFCILGQGSARVVHSEIYEEKDFQDKIIEFFNKIGL